MHKKHLFLDAARRTRVFTLVLCLLLGIIATPLIGVLAAEETVKTLYLHDWQKGDSYYTDNITVTPGQTYTIEALWKYECGTSYFALTNTAVGDAPASMVKLIEKAVPQNGASYDRETGRLTHTFTAIGDTLQISAALGSEGGWGGFWMADPVLYPSDADGNKTGDALDTSPDFSSLWNGYPGTRQLAIEDHERSFFKIETIGLSSLAVKNAEISPAFDSNTREYTVTVPQETTSVEVEYGLAIDALQATVSGDTFGDAAEPVVTVTVDLADGTQAVFTIRVVRAVMTVKTLYLHGWEKGDGTCFLSDRHTLVPNQIYTFSVLYRYECGKAYFTLMGTAVGETAGTMRKLIQKGVPENGVTYDRKTGRLTYTFTATGDEMQIAGVLGDSGNWGGCWFAEPTLFPSDAEGNKTGEAIDLHPDFSTGWDRYGSISSLTVQDQSYAFFDVTPNSLSSLTVKGAELSPAFDAKVYDYTVTVPDGTTSADVDYTLGIDGASVTVEGASWEKDPTDDPIITVTVQNNDGSTTEYRIRVKVEVDPADQIDALHAVAVSGANSSMSTDITIEDGKTYTYTFLWKPISGRNITATLYNNGCIGTDPFKQLIVGSVPTKDVNYDPLTGRVSYTFVSSPGKWSTNMVTVGVGFTGTTEDGEAYFADPQIFESDANGQPVDGAAAVAIEKDLGKWSLYSDGGGQIEKKSVRKSLFLGSVVRSLDGLTVEGYTLTPEFNYAQKDYYVTVPHTVDTLDVRVTLGADGKSYEVTGNGSFVQGETRDVTVTVTNNDETQTVYTIHVTMQRDPATVMKALRLKEYKSDGAAGFKTDLTRGKTYTFTFLWKNVVGENARVTLAGTAVNNKLMPVVVKQAAQDGVRIDPLEGRYSYTFTAQGGKLEIYAELNDASKNHDPQLEAYFALPELFESDENGDSIEGGETIAIDQTFAQWEYTSWGGAFHSVVEVDKDFFKGTFKKSLAGLAVKDYTISPEFNYAVQDYRVTVPYDVRSLTITPVLGAEGESYTIAGNENFVEGQENKVVITVANKDGSTTDYTLVVVCESEPAATLTALDLGYPLSPAFDPNVHSYSVTVPYSVKDLTFGYSLSANATLLSVTGDKDLPVGIPTDVVITLQNGKGIQATYTITVTRQGKESDADAMRRLVNAAAAKVTATNRMTKETLEKALSDALEDKSYSLAVVDFYRLRAVTEVKDNSGIVIPGEKGYVTAIVNITDGDALAQATVKLPIAPPVKEYTFTDDEVSKPEDFTLEDGGKTLTFYSGKAKKVVIPDGVEKVEYGWNDAWDPEAIVMLIVPDSVKTLPLDFGYGMLGVETVYLGDGITELSDACLAKCAFLQYLRLPKNLKKVAWHSLAGTTALSVLRLPDTVETISTSAFFFSLLREITVPASVTKIEETAFSNAFSAAEQLALGSDNVYFWFPFEKNDPRIAKLQAIADEEVDFFSTKGGYVWDKRADVVLGEWDKYGNIGCTPRTVTLLGSDVTIEERAFYSKGIWCAGGNVVTVPAGTKTYEQFMAEVDKHYGDDYDELPALTLAGTDMSLCEAAARAQVAADKLVVSDKATADSVLAAIRKAYYCTKADAAWEKAFTIDLATKLGEGTLLIKDGKLAFTVDISAKVDSSIQPDDPGKKDPIRVIRGTKIAYLDAASKTLTVAEGTKIADLLKVLEIADDYYLQFFDDNGYYIADGFYNSAILEDGFTVRLKKNGETIAIYTIKVVPSDDVPVSPDTGETAAAGAAAVLLLAAASAVVVLRKKRGASEQ